MCNLSGSIKTGLLLFLDKVIPVGLGSIELVTRLDRTSGAINYNKRVLYAHILRVDALNRI